MLINNDAKLAEKLKLYAEGLSVLLAEDDEKLRNITSGLLKKVFSHVDTAQNGKEALELYKTSRYDLVLTDINMPQMNGIELISELRHISDDLAIVVLSAHNESEYYAKLIELGVDAYILKPLDIVSFMYTVARTCKNIQNAKASERLQKELLGEQNKAIAYAKSVSMGKELSINELMLLRKSYKPISAGKFYHTYMVKLEDYADKLEEIDAVIDISIDRLLLNKDKESAKNTSDIFRKYANIITSLQEFNNLGFALEKFASVIENIQNINDIAITKDMLFGISENLRQWRKGIFERRDVENIHYLDASLISDCLQVEAFLTGASSNKGELEFF